MSFEQYLGLEDAPSEGSFEEELEENESKARLGKRAASDDSSDEEMEHPLDVIQLGDDKPLTQAALKKFQDKLENSGVVYLSRIPPFMKHTKLRSLLSPYGELGRVFLNPEDPKITARRKKYKHNKRQNFVEGWVEFMDKKVARQTAALLNNKQIGGKKRSYYYDDIWNMKYLPKFKWNHLTEQLAYELKVKEQRVRTEMAQAKRENNMYIKNVNQSKMIQAIEARNREKGVEPAAKKLRQFKQRKVQEPSVQPVSSKKSNLLSKIFS